MNKLETIIISCIFLKLATSCCIPQKAKFEIARNSPVYIIKKEKIKKWNKAYEVYIDTFIHSDTLKIISPKLIGVLNRKLNNATEFCLLIKAGMPEDTFFILKNEEKRVSVFGKNIIYLKDQYYRSKIYYLCQKLYKVERRRMKK